MFLNLCLQNKNDNQTVIQLAKTKRHLNVIKWHLCNSRISN